MLHRPARRIDSGPLLIGERAAANEDGAISGGKKLRAEKLFSIQEALLVIIQILVALRAL